MTGKQKYADIINLPHHVSANRLQMSMADRAAQFSPFAALVGYEKGQVTELGAVNVMTGIYTGRSPKDKYIVTDDKIELDEETLNILNMKLRLLVDSLDDEPEVTFTYFKPDQRKAGGAYIEVTGKVKKVDGFERLIVMENGIKIPMDDVLDVLILTEERVIE